MILRTKTKIALARAAQRVVMGGRRATGQRPVVTCRRNRVYWQLDLREGIDFSIFLLGSFEPGMVKAYRRLIAQGATVIDIGANIGAHTLPIAACVGAAGRVVAIEPTRHAFERLRRHVDMNPDLAPQITPVQAMLMGNRGATLAEQIASSWPLEPAKDAHPLHGGVRKATTGAVVTTLDDLVADLDLKSVNLLKIDVDGYEVEVLRGARETLGRFAPVILFEHSPYVIVENGYKPSEVVEIFTDAGYRFADLKGRRLASGPRALPEVESGAGVNLMALPAVPHRELLPMRRRLPASKYPN